jgi:hypothetical protein
MFYSMPPINIFIYDKNVQNIKIVEQKQYIFNLLYLTSDGYSW